MFSLYIYFLKEARVRNFVFGNTSCTIGKPVYFPSMKPHFKDNAFVGLAKNVPNPFCQGQRAYCAVDSSLVLFTGLDD